MFVAVSIFGSAGFPQCFKMFEKHFLRAPIGHQQIRLNKIIKLVIADEKDSDGHFSGFM